MRTISSVPILPIKDLPCPLFCFLPYVDTNSAKGQSLFWPTHCFNGNEEPSKANTHFLFGSEPKPQAHNSLIARELHACELDVFVPHADENGFARTVSLD
jgi:hypothetical protein